VAKSGMAKGGSLVAEYSPRHPKVKSLSPERERKKERERERDR